MGMEVGAVRRFGDPRVRVAKFSAYVLMATTCGVFTGRETAQAADFRATVARSQRYVNGRGGACGNLVRRFPVSAFSSVTQSPRLTYPNTRA
jgi:hypothetical protein